MQLDSLASWCPSPPARPRGLPCDRRSDLGLLRHLRPRCITSAGPPSTFRADTAGSQVHPRLVAHPSVGRSYTPYGNVAHSPERAVSWFSQPECGRACARSRPYSCSGVLALFGRFPSVLRRVAVSHVLTRSGASSEPSLSLTIDGLPSVASLPVLA